MDTRALVIGPAHLFNHCIKINLEEIACSFQVFLATFCSFVTMANNYVNSSAGQL